METTKYVGVPMFTNSQKLYTEYWTCLYIYIYIYRERERERGREGERERERDK